MGSVGLSVNILAVVALGLVALGCSPPVEDPAAAESGSSVDTELVSVTRQDVVEETRTQAAVGFGTRVELPIDAEGLVTWTPSPGSILTSGDMVVEVAGRPVFLVVGESPLYRPLRLVARSERDVAGVRLGPQTGQDVAQLQRFLVDQGFDDKGRLVVDELFGLSTQRAVKAWQTTVGHPATGIVDSSQMVFMTNEVLLQSEFIIGEAFRPVEVTGTGTVLQLNGPTTLRDFFPVGATVDVVAEPAVTGVVNRSSRVSSDDGGVRQLIDIEVDGVNPNDLGQSVEVVGSAVRATDVLTIPVRALLAMSDGGWQVEVSSGGDVDRVEVVLIDVVGTTAIIDGLDEGTDVVIPL
jgi:peptidoglycan hydrolase-like protein with peptidoglycan-binding domain